MCAFMHTLSTETYPKSKLIEYFYVNNAVKLHYNGILGTRLKGPLYLKSVMSKLGDGWLSRYSTCNIQLNWPPDSLQEHLPSPW